MADITAKVVRFYAVAPTVANYAAQNGHGKTCALPVAIIKRLIDQNAKVVEIKEVKDQGEVIGYEEIELTAENYNQDLGGMAVPDDMNVTVDIEAEVAAKHEEDDAKRMAGIAEEIKRQQEESKKKFFPDNTVIEGGGQDPVNPPAENPDIPIP